MLKVATLPDVDTVFKAFSDRTRLRIMNLLRGRSELCVCDIIEVLDLQQAKVSRHLAYLRRAGLVDTRKQGQWVYYRLSRPTGSFHKKMLECLGCCMSEVPELQADRKRLGSNADTCGDGRCC
ncbi:MAG: ArsR/SmtB family transcription factor [Phycisphaerales bacterium JB063]